MNAKIQKTMTANITQAHFASELLNDEKTHRAKTTHIAKITS